MPNYVYTVDGNEELYFGLMGGGTVTSDTPPPPPAPTEPTPSPSPTPSPTINPLSSLAPLTPVINISVTQADPQNAPPPFGYFPTIVQNNIPPRLCNIFLWPTPCGLVQLSRAISF